MARQKFPLYSDYRTKLAGLSNEKLGKLFRAILEDRNGITVELQDPELRMAWAFIKDDFNAFDSMYEETCKERKKAILKRWHGEDVGDSQ